MYQLSKIEGDRIYQNGITSLLIQDHSSNNIPLSSGKYCLAPQLGLLYQRTIRANYGLKYHLCQYVQLIRWPIW